MGIVLDLKQMTKAFEEVTITNLTTRGEVKTQVKARRYLETLGYSSLFMERKRTLELIEKGDDFVLSMIFPDTQNPRIRYTMRPSEYLGLVNQRISSFPNAN